MTLRFLVDECCPPQIVEALVQAGDDAIHVLEAAPSAGDDRVAQLSREQARILITFDHGFGDRAVRRKEPLPSLVLLRLPGIRPSDQAAILCRALRDIGPVEGWHTIIEQNRIRRRKL